MNARVAAARARREVEFLTICERLCEKLADAKAAKAASPDDKAVVERHRAAATEVHEFRLWARSFGQPREGVPGRDAVIKVGG